MEPSESMVANADLFNIQGPLPTNEDEEQLINLCTDAGFVKTVVPGQCFMTEDADLHVDIQWTSHGDTRITNVLVWQIHKSGLLRCKVRVARV